MKKVFACVHNAQAAGRVRGIRDDVRRRVAALIEAERWAPR